MWGKEWGFKEGIYISTGLFIIGILLQLTIGEIHWNLLAFPINVTVLALFLASLVTFHLLRKKIALFRWMSGYTAAIPAICWVVAMTVTMGLIRQTSAGTGYDVLGFTSMTTSWPFVLLYIWMVVILGLTTLRIGLPLKIKKIPFLLNHLGLFIALVAATLGNPDMKRLKMTVQTGHIESRATDGDNNIVELPLSIELKDFTIDQYPPKLMLIDNQTGRALPRKSPVQLVLEEGVEGGHLLNWYISIVKEIPMAASVTTGDSVRFTEYHSPGATYAVYVKSVDHTTGNCTQGWVSCGSFMFPYKALTLDEHTSLVMPEREPLRFASDVTVHTEKGKVEETIEVNKPLKIDGWNIYQLGYDRMKGPWSDISVFELVRDPWIPAVYVGIALMAVGALCLFFISQKRKEGEEEV